MASRKRSAPGKTAEKNAHPAFLQRSGGLVSSLRNDSTFADAEICVDGESFDVHCNVVCALSPFFFLSFSGPFQEAEKRKLELKETSVAAVSVLLDYAYCIDIDTALKKNFNLALEVIKLAHRLEVSSLVDTAALAAKSQVTLETSLNLYQILKFYGSAQCDDVLVFISQRLVKVSCTAQFQETTIDDLEKFVSSRYVVATEMEVYGVVKKWLLFHKESVESHRVCSVFSHVYFELFSGAEIRSAIAEREFIPKEALLESIGRRTLTRPDLPAMGPMDMSWRGTPIASGALGVPRAAQGVQLKSGNHVFKLCNFVMSAEIERDPQNSTVNVVLNVIRRDSAKKLSANIANEFGQHGFHIFIQLMEGVNDGRILLREDHGLVLDDVQDGMSFTLEDCADNMVRNWGDVSVVFHITKDLGRGRGPYDPYTYQLQIDHPSRDGYGRFRGGRGGTYGRGRGRGRGRGGRYRPYDAVVIDSDYDEFDDVDFMP